jgi:hypothetical protein
VHLALGHEKLDVYRLSIGYATWVYEKADNADFDPEERKSQANALDAHSSRQ